MCQLLIADKFTLPNSGGNSTQKNILPLSQKSKNAVGMWGGLGLTIMIFARRTACELVRKIDSSKNSGHIVAHIVQVGVATFLDERKYNSAQNNVRPIEWFKTEHQKLVTTETVKCQRR